MPYQTAISWAVMRKFDCIMFTVIHLISLFQGVLDDNLAALCPESACEHFFRHVTALHAAQVAFVASESSEKIRRALRCNTPSTDGFFTNVSKVFFHLRNKSWRGLGDVLDQDGPIVYVRHRSHHKSS